MHRIGETEAAFEHRAITAGEHDRHPLLVRRIAPCGLRGDHLDLETQPLRGSAHGVQTGLAQLAIRFGDEDEVSGQQPVSSPAIGFSGGASIVAAMRPTTAAVMIGLLLLILAAFVVKAQTSGFTP